MAKDEYGGTVALKEFLISGRILDRKITRPALHAAKPLPAKKRRLEKLAARQHKRDCYYKNVAKRLSRGEPVPKQSRWVQFHVEKRQTPASSSRG